MAIDINDFIEGLDPSVLATISGAQLLQLIRNAVPSGSRGLLICDDATPDVGTYPNLARYGWIRPSELNKILRTWNSFTNTWDAVNPQNSTIGTSQIQGGAVTLPKLYNPNDVTKQYWIIRVNAAGTGFELWPLTIDNNSLTINKIIKGPNNSFPHVKADGSTWEFLFPDDIASLFDNGSINIGQITAGIAGTIPIQNSSGTKLGALVPQNNGDVLTLVGGLPAWQARPATIFTSQFISTLQALPGATGSIIVPHTLGVVPLLVDVRFVCITVDGAFNVGEEIPINSVFYDNGAQIEFSILTTIDATNVSLYLTSPSNLLVLKKDGTNLYLLTRANWNIRVRAFK